MSISQDTMANVTDSTPGALKTMPLTGSDSEPTTTNTQAHDDGSAQSDDESSYAKTIDVKRYNGLMSSHQKQLAENRRLQSELEQYTSQLDTYKTREAEVMARVRALEERAIKPQEPDLASMDVNTYTQYIKNSVKEEAVNAALQRIQQEQMAYQQRIQAEEARQRQEAEESWFQDQWNKVQEADPEVNVRELENFMRENRIFNPIHAYNLKYKDILTEKAVAQAKSDTVKKITKNTKTFTEGPSKPSIQAPKKPDVSTPEARKSLLKKLWAEAESREVKY